MKEILASFIFFTRLPLGRVCNVPADSFRQVVAYWPLSGLLTGGLMTAVYLLAVSLHFHALIAVLMAFISRLLLTGALHEDGLTDFIDGFGGGHTREQALAIMKDSHTGSYGVLGLVLYVMLWTGSVFLLTQQSGGSGYVIFFICDSWSKWCASQTVNLLPYARREEDSKIKKTYKRMSPLRFCAGLVSGILPVACCLLFGRLSVPAVIIAGGAVAPVITMLLLAGYMKRRIRGYTGDCCGAVFLLCELSYLLTLTCLWRFT
ncbi:MAG: adenosylcobinamide-GDP ribazoletransferase [Tannerella sp.]|jgi:adenosylcobinamide-GDP ribazoletransferase|nr:adenosylcobinamide-GDP ribazoletransferase [Tannerella sp.]